MMPDDDYPHPLGPHLSENKAREAQASFAAPTGSVPTVEECLWMADTYCQRDSWNNEFWRPHVSVLASEVRRLRAALDRIAGFYRGGERATESMLEMRAIANRALAAPNSDYTKP
jgi:hypothetical protein